MIDTHIEKNKDLVERILKQGHEIGNHMTQDEPTILLSIQDFKDKLSKTHETLTDIINDVPNKPSKICRKVTWFRPGGGFATSEMVRIAKNEFGYQTALGFVWPYDTFRFSSSRFSDWFICNNFRDGSIIILHDKGKDGSRGKRTVETLKLVLPKLTNQGYEIVPLTTLLHRAGAVHRVRPWIELGKLLDQGRQRLINALLQFPDRKAWRQILVIWLLFAVPMLIIGLDNGFLEWQLVEPEQVGTALPLWLWYIQQTSRIFCNPAAIKELFVRALWLPGKVDEPKRDFRWSIVTLSLYILYHVPGGWVADYINKLMGNQTAYFVTFTQPIFLSLTALLGACCTITYSCLNIRSIWPSIIFHWLVVVVWLLFLGGYGTLNPV